jgi:hypothetical protein
MAGENDLKLLKQLISGCAEDRILDGSGRFNNKSATEKSAALFVYLMNNDLLNRTSPIVL